MHILKKFAPRLEKRVSRPVAHKAAPSIRKGIITSREGTLPPRKPHTRGQQSSVLQAKVYLLKWSIFVVSALLFSPFLFFCFSLFLFILFLFSLFFSFFPLSFYFSICLFRFLFLFLFLFFSRLLNNFLKLFFKIKTFF